MAKEFITYEPSQDTWICVCGNMPDEDGFYTCDDNGNELEPDVTWNGHSYICAKCNRIIDGITLEVIGKNDGAFLY